MIVGLVRSISIFNRLLKLLKPSILCQLSNNNHIYTIEEQAD